MKNFKLMAMLFIAGAVMTSCESEEKKEGDGEKKEISGELKDAITALSDSGKSTGQDLLTFVATAQNEIEAWKASRNIDSLKMAVEANAKIKEQAAPMLEAADKAVADVDAFLAEITEAGMQTNVKGDEFREWAEKAMKGEIKEEEVKAQIEEWKTTISTMAETLASWKTKWQEIVDADKANLDALNALVNPVK